MTKKYDLDFIFFKFCQRGLGLGIGDWGLGKSPIPNPQSPTLDILSQRQSIIKT